MHEFADSLRLWQQGMRELADSLRLWQQGMHEAEKVSGSGSRACVKLRKSQALSIFGERGGCERAFLLSFFLAAAAHRFLDKFLVWKSIVCARPAGPRGGAPKVAA